MLKRHLNGHAQIQAPVLDRNVTASIQMGGNPIDPFSPLVRRFFKNPPDGQIAHLAHAASSEGVGAVSLAGVGSGAGRAMPSGHTTPSGQWAENHAMDRPRRRAPTSPPLRIEVRRLPSANTRVDTVVSVRPVAAR